MMSLITFRTDLDQIIDDHFAAEVRADVPAIVATFSADIEHDFVENDRASHGRDEAAAFYTALFADLRLEAIEPLHRYYGDDFVVDESLVLARAVGTPLGIPGRDRPLRFRLLHVFEVRDGLITRRKRVARRQRGDAAARVACADLQNRIEFLHPIR